MSDEDAILRFLRSRRCFYCPILNVRMRKQECVDRHRRRPERRTTRAGVILVYNDPANRYCQSNKCLTGRRIWKQFPRKGKKK